MAHVLIVGITQSGKTTLAKKLARDYAARDVGVVVLDPIQDPDWASDYQTSDPAAFLTCVKNSWQCALFIDESGEMIGRYTSSMFWCATQSRHRGHRAHFITQRPAQLAKTVRDQCTRLLLFAVSKTDAKTLAEEWNKPEIIDAPELPAGAFYDVKRFGPAQKGSIF